jgi:hypothetical protein
MLALQPQHGQKSRHFSPRIVKKVGTSAPTSSKVGTSAPTSSTQKFNYQLIKKAFLACQKSLFFSLFNLLKLILVSALVENSKPKTNSFNRWVGAGEI